MSGTTIGGATLTTPQSTDWVPLQRPADTTPRRATIATLLPMSQQKLSDSSAVSATSISVNLVPRGMVASGSWVVIDPYTSECEVRKVTAITDTTATVAALAYAHAANDGVLWLDNPVLNVEWFGATTAAVDNSAALTRALAQVNANGWVVCFGKGTYNFTSAISLDTKYGITIEGQQGLATNVTTNWSIDKGGASVLQFNGAISGFELKDCRMITWRNLVINGNAAAVHGIHFLNTSTQVTVHIKVESCYINGFATGNGFYVQESTSSRPSQHIAFTKTMIERCNIGIFIEGYESQAVSIDDQCIIILNTTANIVLDAIGNVSISDSIVESSPIGIDLRGYSGSLVSAAPPGNAHSYGQYARTISIRNVYAEDNSECVVRIGYNGWVNDVLIEQLHYTLGDVETTGFGVKCYYANGVTLKACHFERGKEPLLQVGYYSHNIRWEADNVVTYWNNEDEVAATRAVIGPTGTDFYPIYPQGFVWHGYGIIADLNGYPLNTWKNYLERASSWSATPAVVTLTDETTEKAAPDGSTTAIKINKTSGTETGGVYGEMTEVLPHAALVWFGCYVAKSDLTNLSIALGVDTGSGFAYTPIIGGDDVTIGGVAYANYLVRNLKTDWLYFQFRTVEQVPLGASVRVYFYPGTSDVNTATTGICYIAEPRLSLHGPLPRMAPLGTVGATATWTPNETPETLTGYVSQIGPWHYDNMAIDQTNAVMYLTTPNTGVHYRIPMVKAGSILGVVLYSNAAVTAGTITAKVVVDYPIDTETLPGVEAVLDTTNTRVKVTAARRNDYTFAAGALLGVVLTSSHTLAPTTLDYTAAILVEM